jgi:exodeoxyribonuclease VII large subunit
MNAGTPYTVSEYIREINGLLGTIAGSVIGEVSEVKRAASGHVYFTIKDKDSGDILPCTIWRGKYALSSVDIENGMELLVKGKAEYYGPFGKLSLIADSIELVGEGALLKAYEKLKKKLEAEGVFDEARKRPVPEYPHAIGVITSVHGAVVHDFSKNLGKYGFQVKIRDTRVEGAESGRELALSVRAFRKEEIDVLVILRGGGSVQSLAGFDNEALVREIVSFPKPVVAGIGHHQDVPLAALAADASESTPSLVAELINESWDTAQHSLAASEDKILRAYSHRLRESSRDLEQAFERVEKALAGIFRVYREAEQSIRQGITRMVFGLGAASDAIEDGRVRVEARFGLLAGSMRESLEKVPARIATSFSGSLEESARRLKHTERLIESSNPERQLRLGYSLAFSKGKIVRSADDLEPGSIIDVRFSKGGAEAEIRSVTT